MNNIIEYLLLFLKSPNDFTLRLIYDANNVKENLLPLIVVPAILVILVNSLYLYFEFYQKQKPLSEYIGYILQILLWFSFWVIGFPCYPVALLRGTSLNLINVIFFNCITSTILILFFFGGIVLTFFLINRILLIIEPLFPASILAVERGVNNSLSFHGYLGNLLNFILPIMGFTFGCYLIRNVVLSFSIFYNFFWLLFLFLSLIYSIIFSLVRLGFFLFKSSNNTKL
ncbi:MAG: hypothetical protein QNJ70_22775 [Xenococcaceae cyanobacterium MO_207.B15]|nr:hypothetical protein [Xenococcaceae cyanobacterium MO_207.B15]